MFKRICNSLGWSISISRCNKQACCFHHRSLRFVKLNARLCRFVAKIVNIPITLQFCCFFNTFFMQPRAGSGSSPLGRICNPTALSISICNATRYIHIHFSHIVTVTLKYRLDRTFPRWSLLIICIGHVVCCKDNKLFDKRNRRSHFFYKYSSTVRVIILCHGITKHVWTLLSAV